MNVVVPIIFLLAILKVFAWAFCTFWKSCFRLTLCRVNSYSFSAAKFLECSSKFCPLIYPNFLWSILFVNHFWNCLDCFLRVFCLHSLCIYGSGKTSLGELVNTLQHFYLLPVYQDMLDPYTKFHIWISQRLSFFEFTCCLCEPSIWSLWI